MGRHLSIHVDRALGTPLTRQVRDAIRAQILDGSLHPATRLPSSRQLAADLGVSRSVVVEAYDRLSAEGYLDTVRGSGTRVARHTGAAAAEAPVRRAPRGPATPAVLDLRPESGTGANFPHRDWLAAYARAVRAAGRAELERPPPSGMPALRAELAGYLGRVGGLRAGPDRTVVTSGLPAALHLAGTVLRQAGVDRIGVEEPGHPQHQQAVTAAGLSAQPVAVDADGLDVRDLARSGVRAVLVSPGHQFPTGVVLSDRRRAELLRWTRDTDSLVIEADHDGALWLAAGPRPLALQRDAPRHVLHAGAVDHVLAPGLRLGWLCVPPALLPRLRRAAGEREVGGDSLTQLAFAGFLRDGLLDHHSRRVRARCRARRQAFLQAVGRYLPEARVLGTAAGLYACLLLPDDHDEEALVAAARRRAVLVHGVREFVAYQPRPGRPGPPALVVGYAGLPRSGLFEAVRRIGAAAVETRRSGRYRPGQEVLQQLGAAGGGDALRVELDAFHREVPVPDAHHVAVVG